LLKVLSIAPSGTVTKHSYKKSTCAVIVDVWFMFPDKVLLFFCNLSLDTEIIFLKSKIPQNHLLMKFINIEIIAGYTF